MMFIYLLERDQRGLALEIHRFLISNGSKIALFENGMNVISNIGREYGALLYFGKFHIPQRGSIHIT